MGLSRADEGEQLAGGGGGRAGRVGVDVGGRNVGTPQADGRGAAQVLLVAALAHGGGRARSVVELDVAVLVEDDLLGDTRPDELAPGWAAVEEVEVLPLDHDAAVGGAALHAGPHLGVRD